MNASAGKRIIPQLVVMRVASDHQRAIAQGIALNDVKARILNVQGVLPAPDGITGQGVVVGLQKIDILEIIIVDAVVNKRVPPLPTLKCTPSSALSWMRLPWNVLLVEVMAISMP